MQIEVTDEELAAYGRLFLARLENTDEEDEHIKYGIVAMTIVQDVISYIVNNGLEVIE